MAKCVDIRKSDGVKIMSDNTLRDTDPNNARGLWIFGCPAPEKLNKSCTCSLCKRYVPEGEERWFDNKESKFRRKPFCTQCKDAMKENRLNDHRLRDDDGFTPTYYKKIEDAYYKALCRYHALTTPMEQLECDIEDCERLITDEHQHCQNCYKALTKELYLTCPICLDCEKNATQTLKGA